MLMRRQADEQPGCAETGLRHAAFPPSLVVGGPDVPPVGALRAARVHHATASGSPANKLRALDGFLDASGKLDRRWRLDGTHLHPRYLDELLAPALGKLDF